MKRRSFLAMIGLAPVAASVPAVVAASVPALVPMRVSDDGKLTLDVANIDTITAGVIRSKNMTIDMGAGTIVFRHYDPPHQRNDKESWT
jgi:hypothetical protein